MRNSAESRRKKVDSSRELEAIVAGAAMQVPSTYHVISYVVNSGNVMTATANLTLERNGEKLSGVSTGDGPIDAAFHAIEQIIGHHYELDDFRIQPLPRAERRSAPRSSACATAAGSIRATAYRPISSAPASGHISTL